MAALVSDLVEPDPGQAVEGIMGGPCVGQHPFDDGAHAAPGDAEQLADRGLGGVGEQQATVS